jgi:glycosyltransferase involved in cell wall biosynthesis
MIKKQITVLFITHYHGMYGANQSLCKLILELRESYDILPIVLVPSRGVICDVLDQNNIKYYVSHYYWWVNNNNGVFQKTLNVRKQVRNLIRIPKIMDLLKNENIDLVYSNSITINIGYFLSKKLKCSHVWHLRETLQAYNFKFSLGSFFSRQFLKKGADKYIVISDFIKESYASLIPPEKTQRIYNGVSINLIQKRHVNGIENNLHIVCLGVLSEQKNQLEILQAVKILKDKYVCSDVLVHLVGSAKSDYLFSVQQYIAANNLESDTCLHGHLDDVHPLLSKMNLGIMSSRDEAFGRVNIEYMLHRMPVIASISGANEEIIQDGLTGFMYELGDADALAKRIKYFIENPTELERMGNIALHYAETNFSSKQNTQAVYQTIEQLLENSNN